jgi:hypothetical protein
MPKNLLLKHAVILAAILLLVALVYIRIPGTYFCAYDDFVEVHRAAFEDTSEPARVFTTTHFESYKYRPLNRGLNLLTYSLGDGRASFFRTRNVAFHFLNIVLVYLLGVVMFGQYRISAVAAILFGLHPLANQAVVGAVMTNTAAHALFLISLICFLVSLKRVRNGWLWLVIALIAGWLGIFLYEAGIVVFPLMAAYLLVHFAFTRQKLVSRWYVIVLIAGVFILLAFYFGIRARYVPYSSRQAVPKVQTMLKNAAMYAGAMMLPVDSVLAHQWLGTPLPSEIELNATSKIWWVVVPLALGTIIAFVLLLLKPSGRRLLTSIGPNHLLLVLGVLSSLSMLVLFTDKASETYMYLPLAFLALLFTSLLEIGVSRKGTGRRIIYLTIVGSLCILFTAATWVRNGLVAKCGATASRIVTGVRQDRLKDGVWFVWFAAVPGEPRSQRYGMYGWRGIDTVGATAVEPAVQLANDNKSLAARLVSAPYFEKYCSNSRSLCFMVHENGALAPVEPKLSAR